MIVILEPVNGPILGTILVMIGVVTYRIDDWFDTPPTAVTSSWYVPMVDGGTIVDILVCVNDVIASGDDPIFKDSGFWAVL